LKNTKPLVNIILLTSFVISLILGMAILRTYHEGFHLAYYITFESVAYFVSVIFLVIAVVAANEVLLSKIWWAQYIWILPLIGFLVFFNNLFSFAVAILLTGSIYFLGFEINVRLKFPQNSFLNFCVGHVVVAFVSWLIVRFTRFEALYLLQIMLALLVINAAIVIFRNYRAKIWIALKESSALDLKERILLYAVAISYLIKASIYTFSFDDLNGYLFAPLRVYIDHGFLFTPDRPAFLTNVSAYSLGTGSLLATISGWDRSVFLFSFKFFQAISYFLALVTFAYSFAPFKKKAMLRWLWLCLLCFMPLIAMELTCNFTDFYMFLCVLFLSYRLADHTFNLSSELETDTSRLYEAWVAGLFAIASLKSIPYIISFYLIKGLIHLARNGVASSIQFIINGFKTKSLQVIALATPVLILLIDNFRLTGNPTFPSGNFFWKSPFFYSSTMDVVAKRYFFPNDPDGTTFLDLFSLTPQASMMFYSGGINLPVLYGLAPQLLLFLTPVILMLVLINAASGRLINKGNPIDWTSAVLLSCLTFTMAVLSFVTVSFLAGPQHRYFFGLSILVVLGFLSALKPLLDSDEYGWLASRKFSTVLIVLLCLPLSVFVFFGHSYGPPPYTYKKGTTDHILADRVSKQKWLKKRDFYSKVNAALKNDNGKIIMFLLEDKFFLDSKNVYEMDWYDYPINHTLIDLWETPGTFDNRLKSVRDELCREGFRYLILSRDASTSKEAVFFDDKFRLTYLKKTPLFDDVQSLYLLDCNQAKASLKKHSSRI